MKDPSVAEVLSFIDKIKDEIQSGSISPKHIAVLMSDNDEPYGNGVYLRATEHTMAVDEIYMMMSMQSALRKHLRNQYSEEQEILDELDSYLADIDAHSLPYSSHVPQERTH